MKAVWIYINTEARPGDDDYLAVFATEEAAHRWLADKIDPNNVAYEYLVQDSFPAADPVG